MPLLDLLEFAPQGLSVAYRASAAKQEVAVALRTSRAGLEETACGMLVEGLVEAIRRGAAGSDLFDPAAASAELVRAELSGDTPALSFVLELAGVAPVFVRCVVEALRDAGGPGNPVEAMQLFGSFALDASPLSIREGQVLAWLDDPSPAAYPRRWPGVPFPVREREAAGAAIAVRLAEKVTRVLDEELQTTIFTWLELTNRYVNHYGEPVLSSPDHMARLMPKFARSGRELRVTIEEFTRATVPARDLLVNMLTSFHAAHARVTDVEIAL
jgi:hypothetical protein